MSLESSVLSIEKKSRNVTAPSNVWPVRLINVMLSLARIFSPARSSAGSVPLTVEGSVGGSDVGLGVGVGVGFGTGVKSGIKCHNSAP